MNAARNASLASMLGLALSLHVFSVAAVADTQRELSYTYIRLNGSTGELIIVTAMVLASLLALHLATSYTSPPATPRPT